MIKAFFHVFSLWVIAAFTGAVGGPEENSCLVQTHLRTAEKESPFSTNQQHCIKDYVADVRTLMPDYDLSTRKFGGSSKQFPANTTPPILAAGYGSTATRSVAQLGTDLGMRVHHWDPDEFPHNTLVNLIEQLEGSCAERKKLNDVDFLGIALSPSKWSEGHPMDLLMGEPFPSLFLDFYAASPNSKVVITLRNPMDWASSRLKGHATAPQPFQSACGGVVGDLEPEVLAKLFEFHHTLVRCMVPPSNLLEVNIFQDPKTKDVAHFFGHKLRDVHMDNIGLLFKPDKEVGDVLVVQVVQEE